MENREQHLLLLRPEIREVDFEKNMCADERFQNITLRPVIKLQQYLLIEAFKNYFKKHKGVFYSLSLEKRFFYIENAIQKDMKFRNSLKGMVIGQFTVEEYQLYIQNSSALNKRMMNLVKNQMFENIQLLEPQKSYA